MNKQNSKIYSPSTLLHLGILPLYKLLLGILPLSKLPTYHIPLYTLLPIPCHHPSLVHDTHLFHFWLFSIYSMTACYTFCKKYFHYYYLPYLIEGLCQEFIPFMQGFFLGDTSFVYITLCKFIM